MHVAVGRSIWGVNKKHQIFKYLGSNKWKHIAGALTNIDVSDHDHVWGVNKQMNIWRWQGSKWEKLDGAAIQVSVGMAGVWVVNKANDIYHRLGTFGDKKGNGAKVRDFRFFSVNSSSMLIYY